jgi:predicted nucleotidyltransferase
MSDSTIRGEKSKVNRAPVSDGALDEIVQRLVEGLGPDKIILFGSRAYGEPTAGSDVDLVIIVPESSEPAHRRDQAAYKCVGAVGISKDLLVLTQEEFEAQARVATSLARRAKEEGTVLYERGKAHRSLEVVGQEPA